MQFKIRKDRMGYNWLVCDGGLVLAFGARKSYPTELDAHEAFHMIVRDLKAGVTFMFNTRKEIGLYALETPDISPLRFATFHVNEVAAKEQATKVLEFIKEQ